MILVTGAAGLSGSAIIREFARHHYPVRALVRSRAKAGSLAALEGVEIVEGDMLRPETLGPAFAGVERALMISSARERMLDTQCAFVDAAKQAGVAHVVKFSGKESGVGFDSKNFRSMQEHLDIEAYLENSGLAWTHLRPSQFMQFYLPDAATGVDVSRSALILPMDDARLSPVDVEDIAKVAFALLTSEGHEGKRYAMTGPEALTMSEVAERIALATGKPYRYINVTMQEKAQALAALGLPPARIDTLMGLIGERRKWQESRVTLETHRLFGVEPTPFLNFARRYASVFTGETVLA